MNKKTEQWLADLRATPEYHAETIALDLVFECEKRREELGYSYAEIARRMGVSRQRIAKIMTGTQNSTVGSLVKLAMVLGCQIEINLVQQPKKRKAKKPVGTKSKAGRAKSEREPTAEPVVTRGKA